MMGIVKKIGYAVFETPDVPRLSEYYREVLGLTVRAQTADAFFLSCPLDRHSIVLQKGGEPGCTRIGLEVADREELAVLRQRLLSQGISVQEMTDPAPSVDRRISFSGPGHFAIDVQVESEGSNDAALDSKVDPLRLGHVAFKVSDVQRATKFFTDILDFRVSDWIGDFFAFLRCGPEHHTVNFLRNPRERMHHIAFQLKDIQHIQRACDFLGRKKIALIWGPGRHGPGHNVFTYHYDPDGQIIELYAELDWMSDETRGYFDPRPWHQEFPQRPKVWEPGLSTSNLWGVPGPASFRD
jgi:catechol-2,3-dioxygenase